MVLESNIFEINSLNSNDNCLFNYRNPISRFIDINENFILEIELPGIEMKNIDLKINNKSIELKAPLDEEFIPAHLRNRRYFKRFKGFYQTIQLPKDIDIRCIEKSHRNGLLKLKIPKIKRSLIL